jgi:hypothetical protein
VTLRGSDVGGGQPAAALHVGFIGFWVHAPGLPARHSGLCGSHVGCWALNVGRMHCVFAASHVNRRGSTVKSHVKAPSQVAPAF